VVAGVRSGLKAMETVAPGGIAGVIEPITLPVRNLDKPDLIQRLAEARTKYEQAVAGGLPAAVIRSAATQLEGATVAMQVAEFLTDTTGFSGEMHGLRLGDLTLVIAPVELFTEVGLQIRSLGQQVWYVGYADGFITYVPSRKAWEQNTYETNVSLVAPEAADVVLETAGRIVAKLNA
jgi:hypothetical protein